MGLGARAGLSALALALAVGAGLAQTMPPPTDQVLADCAHPVYATDHLVCSDATLRALDKELIGLWAQAGSTHRLDDKQRAAQSE